MITFLISWNFRQNHSFNSTAATWPNCLARLYLPATFLVRFLLNLAVVPRLPLLLILSRERFSNVLHASFQNCSRPKHCSCTSWSLPWTEYRTGAWLWSKFLHFRCCFDRVAAILFLCFRAKKTRQSFLFCVHCSSRRDKNYPNSTQHEIFGDFLNLIL